MKIRSRAASPQRTLLSLVAALVSTSLLLGAGTASAEEKAASIPGPAPKIQWFGTWESAKAEAKRTGRPILLTSAAPQCKGTSGIW